MMAAKGNEYVGKLVENLKRYNRHWLGLPYPTVMFSTGCHYASYVPFCTPPFTQVLTGYRYNRTIHTLQPNRTSLKILAGPRSHPRMHNLNGPVSTPLFNHLGSSSWHSYDAAMIVGLGKHHGRKLPILFGVGVAVGFVLIRRARRRRG